MNIRQQKYKQNRLKGMNQYNAAKAAGYSESMARASYRLEKSVKVRMADIFEQKGLTDSAIVDHALEGLKAVNHTKNGEVPNWKSRHAYFVSICEMTERLKHKIEHTGKDGESLPTPIVNIYVSKNTSNKSIHSRESVAGIGNAEQEV